jgi:hypothetical protein
MAAQKIHLRGQFERVELVAANIIKPGMLVEKTASADTCGYHSTSAGFAEVMIAQEDSLQGKLVTDAYAVADVVTLNICQRGCICYLLCKAGYNYTKGVHLMSNGNGTFRTQSSAKQELAVALEAKDLSASTAVDTLLKCRIM